MKKSNVEFENIRICLADRAEKEEEKIYRMAYDKKKGYRKYCGPDYSFYNWPSANIPDSIVLIKQILSIDLG